MVRLIPVLLVAFVLAGCSVAVPDVKGMTVAKAASALESAGLQLGQVTEVSDPSSLAGTVVAQTPPAGGSASKGAAVTLVVSKGPDQLQVPPVVGKAKTDAISVLEAAGFILTVDERADASTKGTVIAQEPSSGTAMRGATVNITVSTGPEMVKVPDIGGMIDPDPVLKKAGLEPKGIPIHGPIESDAAGIGEAYRQDPGAGSLVPKGTTVTYRFWWETQ
jgi:serine/threonine-protein kinase